MAIEIERKFLVNDHTYHKLAQGTYYCQGYIFTEGLNTVRVRIAGTSAFLTIKGPSTDGISRSEYEYQIPVDDAKEMLQNLCVGSLIEKYRYCIQIGELVWEVDEFLGNNKGLVLAEVELPNIDYKIEIPSWIGKEVTGDVRYYNSYISRHGCTPNLLE